MTAKINVIGTVSIFTLIFCLILYKVVYVPITHDEVATVLYYSKQSYFDIITFQDGSQNNHQLNTVLVKLLVGIFGNDLWVIRLPNLLAFFVYALSSFSITKIIVGKKSPYFLFAILMFTASPYLLDFFGLSRGYGLAVAFCAASISFLLNAFKNRRHSNIIYGIVAAFLASYSSFSSLLYLVATITLSGIYLIAFTDYKREKLFWLKVIITVALGSILLIFPLIKIHETNQYIYWTNNGFIEDTLKSLIRLSLYGSKIFITVNFIVYFILALLLGNLIYILILLKKRRDLKELLSQPIVVTTILFCVAALTNLIQVWLLDVPNLNGRIALFFIPLITCNVLASKFWLRFIIPRWGLVGFSIIFSGLIIHHVATVSKLESVLEWEYDAETIRVLSTIKKEENDTNVTIDVAWIFQPSFSYHSKDYVNTLTLGRYQKAIDPASNADYYYIESKDTSLLINRFKAIMQFGANTLMKNKGN